jgi:TPP-dependent pyruvate/acetoin dehydrogenase alpha subunit
MTGTRTSHTARVAGKNGFSLISDQTFRDLYAALLQCRMLDDRLRADVRYERWTGREASTAGVTACLRSGDSVMPTPRGVLAGYLQNARLAHGSVDAPAQLAAATGDALRHKLEKLGNIAVVFTCTDKLAGRPNDAREIFSTAATHCLPVLYVLEGSLPPADFCGLIPVIRVDDSDAVAVYRVAYESTTRAREGGGPTVMECAAWPGKQSEDALLKLENYLAGKKLFRREWKERLGKKYGSLFDTVTSLA